jgi:hypothetical protein
VDHLGGSNSGADVADGPVSSSDWDVQTLRGTRIDTTGPAWFARSATGAHKFPNASSTKPQRRSAELHVVSVDGVVGERGIWDAVYEDHPELEQERNETWYQHHILILKSANRQCGKSSIGARTQRFRPSIF